MIDTRTLPDGRTVIHYLNLLTEKEISAAFELGAHPTKYEIAIQRAKKIGGKQYRAKWYGGGIVFDTYPAAVEARVKAAVAEATAKEQES